MVHKFINKVITKFKPKEQKKVVRNLFGDKEVHHKHYKKLYELLKHFTPEELSEIKHIVNMFYGYNELINKEREVELIEDLLFLRNIKKISFNKIANAIFKIETSISYSLDVKLKFIKTLKRRNILDKLNDIIKILGKMYSADIKKQIFFNLMDLMETKHGYDYFKSLHKVLKDANYNYEDNILNMSKIAKKLTEIKGLSTIDFTNFKSALSRIKDKELRKTIISNFMTVALRKNYLELDSKRINVIKRYAYLVATYANKPEKLIEKLNEITKTII